MSGTSSAAVRTLRAPGWATWYKSNVSTTQEYIDVSAAAYKKQLLKITVKGDKVHWGEVAANPTALKLTTTTGFEANVSEELEPGSSETFAPTKKFLTFRADSGTAEVWVRLA